MVWAFRQESIMKNEHLVIVASAILSVAAASFAESFAAECCPKTQSGKMVYELVPNVVIPDTISYKPAPKSQANPADMVMSSNYPASYVPYPSYYLPYPTQFRSIQQAIYPVTSVPEDLEAFAQPVTIPSQTMMPQQQLAPPQQQLPAAPNSNSSINSATQTRNETKNEIRLVSANESSELCDSYESKIATCEGNEEKSDATSIQQTASAWSFSSPIFKVASVPAPVLGSGQNSSLAQTSKFGTTQVNMPPGMYDMPIPYDKCSYGAKCGEAPPHHCAVRAYIAQKIQYKQAQQQMLYQMQLQQWQMMQQQMPQQFQQATPQPQMMPPQTMMNPYGNYPYAAMNPQMNQMMNAMPNPMMMNQMPSPNPMTYQVAPVMSPYGMQPQFVPQQFPQPQYMPQQMMPQQFQQQFQQVAPQTLPLPQNTPQVMPLTNTQNLSQEIATSNENGENSVPAPVMSAPAPSIASSATAAMNTAAPQQSQMVMQGMMPYPQPYPPYGMAQNSTLTPYDVALLAALIKGNSRRDAVKERRQEKRSPASTDPLSMFMEAWGTPNYPQGTTARMPSKTAYPWGYFGAQSAPQQTANFGGYYNTSFGNTSQPGM